MLWDKRVEKKFFQETLDITTPETLFYRLSTDKQFYAYYPKGYSGKTTTIQSRNTYIGNFTEKWFIEAIEGFAKKKGLFAVQDVVCEEIGLNRRSPADVALCKKDQQEQRPEDIELLFEVKMSLVWNWMFKNEKKLVCVGDYNSHKGTPSLLRSDSMLKAIGKSINIRVSGVEAAEIPIVIVGNTPIQKSYYSKVDHLKKSGIIQGFISVNTDPLDGQDTLKETEGQGFMRMNSENKLINYIKNLLVHEREFFSSFKSKKVLGKIISISNKEKSYEKKAEKFLELLRENH